MRAQDRLSKPVAFALLTALVGAALALRMRGLEYLLPHSTHLDASVIKNQVDALRGGAAASSTGALDEWYPYLLARLSALFRDPLAGAATLELEGHLARAAAPFLQIRWVSVLGAVPIVTATYLLTRRFATRGWSLFAAALLATSPLNISFAQQERPHALAASLVAFTLLAALRLERRPTIASSALVGLCASLAIGALQNGVAVGLPIAAAAVLALARPAPERPRTLTVLAGAGACFALLAAGARAFYPFHFEGDRGYLAFGDEAGATTFNISGQSVHLAHFDGAGFGTLVRTTWAYLPHIAVLLAVASVAWIVPREPVSRTRRSARWIALAYAVPYTLVIGLHSLTWERYLMPLEPLLAAYAAWGLGQLAPNWPRAVRVVALLAVGAASVIAWRIGTVRSAPDTHELAAEWLQAAGLTEQDSIVALPYIDLPLFHRDQTLAERPAFTWWSSYQRQCAPQDRVGQRFDLRLPKSAEETVAEWGDDPLEHLARNGARFVLVQQVGEAFRHKLAVETRRALVESAQLRARFSPLEQDDGRMAAFGTRRHRESFARPFFVSLFTHARMGPTLELYELPRR